jgi:uncharacterized membrane protein
MSPFQEYNRQICRHARDERLLRLLAQCTFDGAELHRVVDRELRGPENEIAAANLKHAIVSQYHDTIPLDAAIEIIAGLLDKGELA